MSLCTLRGSGARVRPVDREHIYAVLLVHSDERAVDGLHVYRGERLPERDQVITVETALNPVPLHGSALRHRARVTRVIKGDAFPVRAMELEPETVRAVKLEP
jgi:hypothetical protein